MAIPTYLGDMNTKEKLTGFKVSRFNVRIEDKLSAAMLFVGWLASGIDVATDQQSPAMPLASHHLVLLGVGTTSRS